MCAIRYMVEELVQLDLPLQRDEIRWLWDFAPRFTELCDELAAYGVPETVQHDDLHHANLDARGGRVRVLDWGDASISHPFASLVGTFARAIAYLRQRIALPPEERPLFDTDFSTVLRRAVAQTLGSASA